MPMRMKIEHRNLTRADLDALFLGPIEVYEDILALGAWDYLAHGEDGTPSDALAQCEQDDYKFFRLSDPDGIEKDAFVIHGFPGDAGVWAVVDEALSKPPASNAHNDAMVKRFKLWYKDTTENGSCFDSEIFYTTSEGCVEV